MNWVESKHRNEEERVKKLWEANALKVETSLYQLGETLKTIELINGVSKDIIEINDLYISDESNDEYTSYKLKERRLSGYISYALALSPYLIEKYQLDFYKHHPIFNSERILNLAYKSTNIENDTIRKAGNISNDYSFIEADCRLTGREITLCFGIPPYKHTNIKEKHFKLKCCVVGLYDNKEMLQVFFLIPNGIEKHLIK